MHDITAEHAQALLDAYLADALAERERWRESSGPLTDANIDAELGALQFIARQTRDDLVHHDYAAAERQLEALLADAGLPCPTDESLRRALARRLLLTDARLVATEIRRTQGDYDLDATALSSSSAPAAARSPTLLSAAIDDFIDEQIRASRWTDKTHQAVVAMLRDLVEISGDRPVAHMSKDVLREYKQTLMRLPPNRRKVKRFRDKTITQILALPNVTPISVKTVNDTLATVSQFFGWALDQGFVSSNPAKGLQLHDARRDDEQRAAFDTAQLEQIFRGPEFSGTQSGSHRRRPYQFWLPILGLFTGARIEELSSLMVSDVREIDGVWCIDINTAGGAKRVKTKNAVRHIALHPTVITLGFVEYVEQLRERGHDALFPELSPRQHGRKGIAPSRWFARFLDRCGIDDKALVFHSFRHTLINALKQAEAPETLVCELAGHQNGNGRNSVTFGRYGKRLSPAVQLAHLEKIDFGIDFSPLAAVWPRLMRPIRPRR